MSESSFINIIVPRLKTIFRTNPQKEFTVLANRMLRDKALSFKARGMLAMIMTHSETWEVHASWITEQGTEGREAISSGLTELEALGYVQYQQATDAETKQFTGGLWTFSDSPCPPDERTNKTRWQQKYAAAQEEAKEVKPAGNRGLPPRDTGSRTTDETTGSRDTGSRDTATPQHGNPPTKKKEGNQKDHQPKEGKVGEPALPLEQSAPVEVLMEESPGDLMGWKEIGQALLEAFNRPAHDIQQLGNDEHHWLVEADRKCTREELASLVRYLKKPHDRNNPLLIGRSGKMRTLLQNFREQIALALQTCPPKRGAVKPASTPNAPGPVPEAPTEAAWETRIAEIAKMKKTLRGSPPAPAELAPVAQASQQ